MPQASEAVIKRDDPEAERLLNPRVYHYNEVSYFTTTTKNLSIGKRRESNERRN